MALLVSRLGAAYDRACAYVYLLASPMHRVVYVGETNDMGGAVARAGAHLRPGGTFTERFEEAVGFDVEAATDLALVSARLPQTAEFTGVETSYRRGVEYLVHVGLNEVRGGLGFRPIAWVQYSARAEEAAVKDLARGIVAEFAALYPSLATL